MRIAVCMKQVPAYSEGNMDKETGLLIRTGLKSIVNSYDSAALEAALRLKEQVGGQVDVFTMGPPAAENVLREAFAMGGDEGYLICGSCFAGADVLATSYTLMQAITVSGPYDLILCGRQTTDGDTAQVSGALAAWMNLPHMNWVEEIGDATEEGAVITYRLEEELVRAKIKFPCLLAVERDSFIPRMPSLKLKMAGRKKAIHTITLESMADQNPEHYGTKGSATKVKAIFPPPAFQRQEPKELAGEQAADCILSVLDELHLREED